MRPGERVETPERLAQAGLDDLRDEVPLESLDNVLGSSARRSRTWPPNRTGTSACSASIRGTRAAASERSLFDTALTVPRTPGTPSSWRRSQNAHPFSFRDGFELLLDDVEPANGLRFRALRHAPRP